MLPGIMSTNIAGFVSGMALATGACRHEHWETPAASAVPLIEESLGQNLPGGSKPGCF